MKKQYIISAKAKEANKKYERIIKATFIIIPLIALSAYVIINVIYEVKF